MNISSVHRDDHSYMEQALTLAQQAAAADEVPIGAVVVNAQGTVIGQGYNQRVARHSILAHAEILALEEAAATIGDWRLDGCTLYVTLEPCPLCMQVILMSRVNRLVWGADSPLYGFTLDKDCTFHLYKTRLHITTGLAAYQAQELLRLFFKNKR
ncbi:nucleoside deaminase [Candidatus Dependentiae bacterium]|nr:nucleoside deaminase [Candidatus Dependentiae bacterium]